MLWEFFVYLQKRVTMGYWKRFFGHLKTILTHKKWVFYYMSKMGFAWRGLFHDMSKFAPVEFFEGVKYWNGHRSPINVAKENNGYSYAWLHHKGRNKHHFEYWIDWQLDPQGGVYYAGNRMPVRYVAEMFCDRIAACRVYMGEKYTDASPWEYFQRGKNDIPIHPETAAELEKMLLTLKDEGEDAAFRYVRRRLKEEKW